MQVLVKIATPVENDEVVRRVEVPQPGRHVRLRVFVPLPADVRASKTFKDEVADAIHETLSTLVKADLDVKPLVEFPEFLDHLPSSPCQGRALGNIPRILVIERTAAGEVPAARALPPSAIAQQPVVEVGVFQIGVQLQAD